MNLTDVDDKIIKRAHEQGKTITQVTDPVTEIFHADRKYLRIEDAEVYPTATGHIPEMIALVERLLEKGIAYKADDGSVYFAIDRFPGYGRLSRLDKREIKAGARVAQDDYTKENAQDFALWKAAKDEDEADRCRVGRAIRSRASGLAPRVLGHGDEVPRRDARHSWRRRRPRLSASRGRDRAVRGGDRSAVFALLVPRRVPAGRRHQDVQADRQRLDGFGPAREGHFGGRTAAFRLLHALPEADQPLGLSARGVDRGGGENWRVRPPAARGEGWDAGTGGCGRDRGARVPDGAGF